MPLTGSVKQILKLHFAELWRTDKNDRLVTVATLTPTFGVTAAQLQITLGSALPATDTLLIYAVVDVPTATVPKPAPADLKHPMAEPPERRLKIMPEHDEGIEHHPACGHGRIALRRRATGRDAQAVVTPPVSNRR